MYARSDRNGTLHDGFTHRGIAKNALCGDEVEVRITEESGIITECTFRVRGCAICTASTALMSDSILDMSRKDAEMVARNVERYITDDREGMASDEMLPDDIVIFKSLQNNPRRRECALLPWRAMEKSLEENS